MFLVKFLVGVKKHGVRPACSWQQFARPAVQLVRRSEIIATYGWAGVEVGEVMVGA